MARPGQNVVRGSERVLLEASAPPSDTAARRSTRESQFATCTLAARADSKSISMHSHMAIFNS